MPDPRLSDLIEIWWADHCHPMDGHLQDKGNIMVDVDVSLCPETLTEIRRRVEEEWDTTIIGIYTDRVICTLYTAIDSWLISHPDLAVADAAAQVLTQVLRFDAADRDTLNGTLTPWLEAIAAQTETWEWAQYIPISYEQLHIIHRLPFDCPELPACVVGAALAIQAPTTRPGECSYLAAWLSRCGVPTDTLDACLAYAYDYASETWWGDSRGQD